MTRDEISRNQRTTLLALRLLHGIYSRRRSCGPIHHLCNIAASPSDLGSSETAIFPHNNPRQTFAPFFANPRLPFDIISPLLQLRFEEYRASFRILFCAIRGDRTEKRNDLLERKRERKKIREKERERDTHAPTQHNSEKFTNGSRYECFPMARYLRARHEYLLQKKVLTRALLRARRRSFRSYAKSIRE